MGILPRTHDTSGNPVVPVVHTRRDASDLGSGKPEVLITDKLAAHLVRPNRHDEPQRLGKLGRARQWVESVSDALKAQLTLDQHKGRTIAGVYSRIAVGILQYWRTDAPARRSLIAYDHQTERAHSSRRVAAVSAILRHCHRSTHNDRQRSDTGPGDPERKCTEHPCERSNETEKITVH